MQKITGMEISPRKIEYMKFLLERGDTVRTSQMASHLGVDPSTATKTINELADAGYVKHTPYRGVSLTDRGEEYAEFLVKRHRILSLMLNHYGLSSEEACQEVGRFEGYVSRYVIDRICSSMGHPTVGVCGLIAHDGCDMPEK
ncbi:MAG: metal-dependent transcriptional regulator [Methanosarcinaceae archaeon]|nr:metal-dependent transcriptional regulator [Methanosarcinaceae archaeon]